MYNENTKVEFMSTLSDSYANDYRLLFGRTEPFEEKLGKDLLYFSKEEIGDYFEAAGMIEPQNLRTYLGMLGTYGDWCSSYTNNQYDLRTYRVEDFPYAKLMKPLIIETPKKLCSKLETAYPSDSGQPAMAALCLAWLGIECGDAIKLTNDQVDTLNGHIVSSTGEVLVASMPECIRKMLHEYKLTTTRDTSKNIPMRVKVDDMGFFIKRLLLSNNNSALGKPVTKKHVSDWIVLLRDKYNGTTGNDQTLVYGNVQRSGGFYRLHQMELAGVDVRNVKNADKVRLCLGKSKRNHKDNMLMYDAYLEVIGAK